MEELNEFGKFVREQCLLGINYPDLVMRVTLASLYDEFIAWSHLSINRLKGFPALMTEFMRLNPEYKIFKYRTRNYRYYYGLTLRSKPETFHNDDKRMKNVLFSRQVEAPTEKYLTLDILKPETNIKENNIPIPQNKSLMLNNLPHLINPRLYTIAGVKFSWIHYNCI